MSAEQRKAFADFLDRAASWTAFDRNDWERFAVTHYHDEFLEELRRCTVRLQIGQLAVALESDDGRQLLRAWAVALRASV